MVDVNLLAKKLNNQKIISDLLLNEEDFDEEPRTVNPMVVSVIAEEDTSLRHRRSSSRDLNQPTGIEDGETNQPDDLIKIGVETDTSTKENS